VGTIVDGGGEVHPDKIRGGGRGRGDEEG